jgi:hypothetical protein
VRAHLATDQNGFLDHALGTPATALLTNEFPARSLPGGSIDHVISLRFWLSSSDVEELERRRHVAGDGPFFFYLGIEAVVAGLKTYNQAPQRSGSAADESLWPMHYGMFSQVFPFWRTEISPILVAIEGATWIRDVLPRLGYDRHRVVEISFPPPFPDHPSAASEWDKARRALDEQRYSDCVSECRDLLAMWQNQLKATKSRHVATIIAEEQGWADDDGRTRFLDRLWIAATDIVNVPHHPEGELTDQAFGAADARLMLMLTACLSQYVSDRVRPAS